jgi:antitoxin Phd
MKTWSVQDAKARFSEFLDSCLHEGPQLVTKRGADAAVLVSIGAWKRLQHAARPTLKELLLCAAPRGDLHVRERGKQKRRPPPTLD